LSVKGGVPVYAKGLGYWGLDVDANGSGSLVPLEYRYLEGLVGDIKRSSAAVRG
jgi:hypothetical protein